MNLEARRLARWTRKVLRPHGFSKENTLAVVLTCRDEICHDVHHRLERSWGQAFDGRSLAGMPWLGTTGMGAALSHAPLERGKRRLVIVHLSHIGFAPAPGVTVRDGVSHPTCGAVQALLDSDDTSNIRITDTEQTLMVHRLKQVLENGTPRPTSMEDMTALVQAMALSDLQVMLADVLDPQRVDHALISGCLEHRPTGDTLTLTHATVRVDGDLSHLFH